MNQHEVDCWDHMDACRRFFGVPRLAWSDELHDTAYRWASQMCARGGISHSDLRTLLYGHRDRRKVGENVGVGGSVPVVFAAWLHSPPHFKNLVERDFTHGACGIAESNGSLWLVQHFARIT